MFGQPYKVHLELEMPESPSNKELGLYIVVMCALNKLTRFSFKVCLWYVLILEEKMDI